MTRKKWGTFVVAGVVLSSFVGAAAPRAVAQRLLVSTETDALSAGAKATPFREEDVLFLGNGSGPSSFVSWQNWRVLVGDADGDGHFDDQPSEVDALAIAPGAPERPSAFDILVSFSTDRTFPSGLKARDGDVIRLVPGGSFEIAYSEDMFTGGTGTTAIDVDALAVAPDGTFYFSFAEDEITAAGYLAAENGGNATLDEACVFRWQTRETEAHLFLTPENLIAMVNHAVGTSLTTVGDLQGLELDPANPGALLFAVSSKSRGPEGTVFTTAGGGQVAVVGGVTLAGDSMGFSEPESLDSLALVPDQKPPFEMRADVTEASLATNAYVEIFLGHGTPLGEAVVLVSPAMTPTSTPVPMPKLRGTGRLYVDTTSVLFKSSLRNPKFRTRLDANGCGTLRFPTAGSPVGIVRFVQSVDVASFEATEAVAIETIP